MTVYPRYETLDFVQTSGVATNKTLTGSDFDTAPSSKNLSSNEVFEVERIEMLPPTNADGSIQTFEYIQLQDGKDFYPYLNLRSFMLGWDGANSRIRSPKLGVPVLSNKVSPSSRPILTACPKFGPDDSVNVSLKNDGTAISDTFTIRVVGWRFKGSEADMQNYFSRAPNVSNSIDQSVSMSNPFKDEGQMYSKPPVSISRGPGSDPHTEFTNLTGGMNQAYPKVYPWATWAQNSNATQANTWYSFDYYDDNVSNKYQSLYENFSDSKKAAIFDYVMASEGVTNLQDLRINLVSRPNDAESVFNVTPTDQHELPEMRRLDGSVPSANQTVVQTAGPSTTGSPSQVGTAMPLEAVDRIPRRLDRVVQPVETVVWDDEGGVQIRDDGTILSADSVMVAVYGHRLELQG